MHAKRAYVLLFTAAVLSLTVIPTAAAALPASVSEYMARFAAGKLYVPYYELHGGEDGSDDAEQPSEQAPPVSESGGTSGESGDTADKSPPDGGTAVQAFNLCRYEEGDDPPLLLMNETSYKAYPQAAADRAFTIERGAVLIIHTHGTEAYLPDGVDRYAEDEDFRSDDPEETVVAVGDEFARRLSEAGIEVYHDRTMYDAASFENAYTAARNAVKSTLKEKPQIRYIIDLHRDAVTAKDGSVGKTLCRVNGGDSAQVMLVVGTDEAGAAHADWRDNFCVASKYQRLLNAYPTLARPIYLRKASYNQQLSPGGLLLEVGSAGNTLSEAKTAARYAAEAFIVLYGELCP